MKNQNYSISGLGMQEMLYRQFLFCIEISGEAGTGHFE
jgi:hypothetical protein